MKAEIRHDKVFVDGSPFSILSGEMHYFRIHPSQWEDRLKKLKACGLNTVATYMPWNLHERKEGEFNFSGMLDIQRYLTLANELGLKVILRPGPYICAEWDFGGLPAWLFKRNLRIRCSDPEYSIAVKRYFEAVLSEVKEFFDINIILLQIENGYSSFGNDIAHYDFLKKLVDDSGYGNIIITADGDSDTRINSIVPEGVWQTLMCGEDSIMECLEFQRKKHPDEPQMVIEYWTGHVPFAGQPVRHRDPILMAENLDKALAYGAHINLYMFGGGTNFGFMNGAMRSIGGGYRPLITSYDISSPLSESGDVTESYFKFREVLKKYNPEFDESTEIPPNQPKKAYGRIELSEFATLGDNLDALSVHTIESPVTLSMEEAGGDYGYIRYTTQLAKQDFVTPMRLYRFEDKAWVYFKGAMIAHLHGNNDSFNVDTRNGSGELDIVVENMGRTNFYCNMGENRKGITGGLLVNNQQFQNGWKISTMPLENTDEIEYHSELPARITGPVFLRGTFEAKETADTFLEIPGGSRGICRINNTTLGRYDNIGPQLTLYIPAAFLRKGENTVEVLEYDKMTSPFIRLLNYPKLGG